MSDIVRQNLSELINCWFDQERNGIQYPVPLHEYWDIAGHKKKQDAYWLLNSLIEKDSDFLKLTVKQPGRGRPSTQVWTTVSGLLLFLLSAKTEEGKKALKILVGGLLGCSFKGNNPCENKAGFIYLVKQDSSSFYKIGKSKKPHKRLESLQIGSPVELIIVERYFSMDCGQLECLLHKYYKHYWVRGEWFDFPGSVVKDFLMIARELDGVVEDLLLDSENFHFKTEQVNEVKRLWGDAKTRNVRQLLLGE